MRELADALGVRAMTIYNYVPNKAALFELVQNKLLARIEVPPPEAGTWDVRVRILQRDARAVVADHVGIRLGSGLGRSAEAARLADGVRDILSSAGFESEDLSFAFTTLFTFMLGQVEVDALAKEAELAQDVDLPMPSGIHAPGRDAAFEYAFDVLIAGLRTKLPKTPRKSARRR
jgi:AcrR family transcriptional regulator